MGLLSFPRRLSDYRVSSPGRGVEGFRGTCLDELSEGAVEWRTEGRSGMKERLEVVIYLRRIGFNYRRIRESTSLNIDVT